MRVPQPDECRGSLNFIRKLVEERPDILESALRNANALASDASINWLSPRKGGGWAEYRDESFLNLLGHPELTSALAAFWPRGGPQWDALGRGTDGTLFLIEAKAHVGEMKSTCAAQSTSSRALIASSLEKTRLALGASGGKDWHVDHYQFANRLAHLGFLRENGVSAYLVLVYFTGETGMPGAPVTVSHWNTASIAAREHLGLRPDAPPASVIELHVDVNELGDGNSHASMEGTIEGYPAGYPYRERFENFDEVLVGEGGSLYTAESSEGFVLVSDESTLADIMADETDSITVRLFASRGERDEYLERFRTKRT